jgi:hypothetical protein
MSGIKQLAGNVIIYFLRRKNVPVSRWPEHIKKTGSWFFIASIVLVIPLLVFDNIPAVLTILLQLGYAALMCLGLLLTLDGNDKNKR